VVCFARSQNPGDDQVLQVIYLQDQRSPLRISNVPIRVLPISTSILHFYLVTLYRTEALLAPITMTEII
jgi:hypothetical protein